MFSFGVVSDIAKTQRQVISLLNFQEKEKKVHMKI